MILVAKSCVNGKLRAVDFELWSSVFVFFIASETLAKKLLKSFSFSLTASIDPPVSGLGSATRMEC